MDVLLCPCAPAAGAPHDFPLWWGYTSLFNILDLPSVVLPLRDFKIDPTKDEKDQDYIPRDTLWDKPNYDICTHECADCRATLTLSTDDPELWQNMPVALQVVGRSFRDEQLLADSAIVDAVLNRSLEA
jgi:amidase